MEITMEYYRWAAQILHWLAFETERDREIWALHAEGLTMREIGQRMGFSCMAAQRSVTATRSKAMKGMIIYEREEEYALEQQRR